jgi:hypothetical protein
MQSSFFWHRIFLMDSLFEGESLRRRLSPPQKKKAFFERPFPKKTSSRKQSCSLD